MKFVLSTEEINRYGFRVLTSGIDFSDFAKNPIMLYNHQRSMGYDTERLLPIGKWDNIRIEGGNLVADAVFDDNDEFAVSVKDKVEQGMLNAASISFDVRAISEEPVNMLPGQTRPTVTKCAILEASVTDLPGNAGCLKMNFPKEGISLSGDVKPEFLNGVLPLVKLSLNENRNMKKIALKLGLNEDATEEQVLAAIEQKLSVATSANDAAREKMTTSLLAFGKAKGVITDKNEGAYKTLAVADFNSTLALINDEKAPAAETAPVETKEAVKHESIADAIRTLSAEGTATGADDRTKWSLTDWRKKDPSGLELIRDTKPEEYQKLVKTLK